MGKAERIAPDDGIWVCAACGKTHTDRYGIEGVGTPGWDESCMLHAVLCRRRDIVPGTRLTRADPYAIKDTTSMGEVYRHKKRGSQYTIVGDAEFQLASDAPIEDGEVVVVYRSQETGEMYARRKSEFLDGRFEEIWPRSAQDIDLPDGA